MPQNFTFSITIKVHQFIRTRAKSRRFVEDILYMFSWRDIFVLGIQIFKFIHLRFQLTVI